MSEINIRALNDADREIARQFTLDRWGDIRVIAHGEVYYPHLLPGFIAADAQGQWIGLITYRIMEDSCEVVTLDSLHKGQGIGSALIAAVRGIAEAQGCKRLWLITTNDNLNALRFYQKRGFRMVAVHPGAVDWSRTIKPSIPEIGFEGIPLHDEIELQIRL